MKRSSIGGDWNSTTKPARVKNEDELKEEGFKLNPWGVYINEDGSKKIAKKYAGRRVKYTNGYFRFLDLDLIGLTINPVDAWCVIHCPLH